MSFSSIRYAALVNGLRLKDALVARPGAGQREVHEFDFIERGVEEILGEWQQVEAEFEELVTSLFRKRQMDALDNSQTPVFDPATGALTGQHASYVLADYAATSEKWRGLVLMQHLKMSGFGLKEGEGRLAVLTSKGSGKPPIPGYGWTWIGKPPITAADVGKLSEKITVRKQIHQGMRVLIHAQCADPPAWPTGANDWSLQCELVSDDGGGSPIVRYQLPAITGVGAWVAEVRITDVADEVTDLDWYVRTVAVEGSDVAVGAENVSPNFTPTFSFTFIND